MPDHFEPIARDVEALLAQALNDPRVQFIEQPSWYNAGWRPASCSTETCERLGGSDDARKRRHESLSWSKPSVGQERRGPVIAPTASPWPNQPCPHLGCSRRIRDLLAEMVPGKDQASAEFKAVVGQQPGGAITCPFCQGALEYEADGKTLVPSQRTPLRYSRGKMEGRATDYGSQKNPPNPQMTSEEWIAEDKLMPGALQGYTYAEDPQP